MIPLFKVGMSDLAAEKVTAVLNSGFIGQGPIVEEFEDKLWHVLKSKTRPVTVNSCTAAIDLSLDLLNIKPGDEIIATPQTCFASNVGAIHRGARLRWADIDPLTGLIDPVEPILFSVASGHGIGKSALSAIIIIFIIFWS